MSPVISLMINVNILQYKILIGSNYFIIHILNVLSNSIHKQKCFIKFYLKTVITCIKK